MESLVAAAVAAAAPAITAANTQLAQPVAAQRVLAVACADARALQPQPVAAQRVPAVAPADARTPQPRLPMIASDAVHEPRLLKGIGQALAQAMYEVLKEDIKTAKIEKPKSNIKGGTLDSASTEQRQLEMDKQFLHCVRHNPFAYSSSFMLTPMYSRACVCATVLCQVLSLDDESRAFTEAVKAVLQLARPSDLEIAGRLGVFEKDAW